MAVPPTAPRIRGSVLLGVVDTEVVGDIIDTVAEMDTEAVVDEELAAGVDVLSRKQPSLFRREGFG